MIVASVAKPPRSSFIHEPALDTGYIKRECNPCRETSCPLLLPEGRVGIMGECDAIGVIDAITSIGGDMRITTAFLVAILACSLAGCYEMKQDEQGRTVKLNKITGTVTVLEGGNVVKVTNQKDARHEESAAKKVAEPTTWPDIPLPIDGASAKLTTKWSDGNLYYQFTVNKDVRYNKKHINGFRIILYDESGFLIDDTVIDISEMDRNYTPDNKTIESMESKGQKEMSLDIYEKIDQWNVAWLTPK